MLAELDVPRGPAAIGAGQAGPPPPPANLDFLPRGSAGRERRQAGRAGAGVAGDDRRQGRRLPRGQGSDPQLHGRRRRRPGLAELDEWQAADTVKANPDMPQLPVRTRALAEGKLLYLAVPRLRDPSPFLLLDPDRLEVTPRAAASIKGSAVHGIPTAVRPDRPRRPDRLRHRCRQPGRRPHRQGWRLQRPRVRPGLRSGDRRRRHGDRHHGPRRPGPRRGPPRDRPRLPRRPGRHPHRGHPHRRPPPPGPHRLVRARRRPDRRHPRPRRPSGRQG